MKSSHFNAPVLMFNYKWSQNPLTILKDCPTLPPTGSESALFRWYEDDDLEADKEQPLK